MIEDIPFYDDLVYDVGMHKGEDSAFYLALGYRVVAFEANPDLAAGCRTRFAAEIESGILTIVDGAIVSGTDSAVAFFVHPVSVWGTTQDHWAERNAAFAASRQINVPRADFAEILRRHGMPFYLKVDIEGSDEACLREVLKFRQRPMYVSLESAQTDWRALLREFDLLEDLGYERFAVVQQCNIPGRTLTTVNRQGNPARYRFEPDSSGPFGRDIHSWCDRSHALNRYRRIFLMHRLLGARSPLNRNAVTRAIAGNLARIAGRPLPGWHDTHAARFDT